MSKPHQRLVRGAAALLALFLFLSLSLVGCGSKKRQMSPAPGSAPVWSRDIGPLIARRCGACHGDNPTAALPPPLASYDDLRRNAASALQAVRRRMMPPFGADNTGLCGTWADANWLPEHEIAIFGAWVEQGMPHGEAAPARPTTAPSPSPPERWQQLRVGAKEAFIPGLGTQAYRCFAVDPPQMRAKAIVAVTVTSQPVGAVRQATLYAIASEAGAHRARRLDASGRTPGWPCHGAPDIKDAALLASWSRNSPVQSLPAGTGVPLGHPTALVLQVRYDLVASPPGAPVHTRMELTVADDVRPARFVRIQPASPDLPAGQAQIQLRSSWTVDRAARLWGVVPAMNTLGRVMDLEVVRAGARSCFAHFGHWDLYDQQLFRLITPTTLGPGDAVSLRCDFSTSSRTETTKMGEASDDERCLAQLYVVDEP